MGAVSSPLLANILGEVEDQEIILDWESSLVTSLLQYLYTGEVRLDQVEDKEDLQEMMRTSVLSAITVYQC